MADTTVRYEPRNYRRLCDVCGMLRNISDMHRQDDLWVCTYDAGERVRTELDRLNARERPFQIKPVPHPKPQNPYYPNTLETDDAAVFNFLAQQVTAQCRYEQVQSGAAPMASLGGSLPGLSWAARYFYDLIQANDRRADLIARAKVILATIADFLQTRQRGFGLSPASTRANDLFYGGFLASGATVYVTQDTATSGLALLYAYRVLGLATYRDGARAAASYLRNVQAIGSDGSQHTSSDPSGTSRLYTGAVCSEVSTTFGVDPGQFFYSNHLFYPGGLIALEFWNELKTTDGDQSIGCTATLNGFDSTPAQLLSTSITDMRTCWETGITDATGEQINGLSSTTPREFFNAYPQVKSGFVTMGTGMWQYVDGDADTGTQVSSQNFCAALSALYNYEGATTQVTTISDWLRTFTSNPDFETPDDTSTSDLYRSTTGTYDATLAPATLLTVRDADDEYAATAENGSSLYDWGAFGLLSRIWASRNRGSFMTSRLYPLNTVQRYFDGNATDIETDRVELRGLSGLTMQTGFLSNTNGTTPGAIPYQQGSAVGTTPPGVGVGLVLWLKGDAGRTVVGSALTAWADQSGYGQNFGTDATYEPAANAVTINGIPCASFSAASTAYLIRAGLRDRNGVQMGYNTGETQSVTVMAVFKPGLTSFSIYGGPVFMFGGSASPPFQCIFDNEDNLGANGWWLYSRGWRNAADSLQGPNVVETAFNGAATVGMWSSSAFPDISVAVNGSSVSLTPTTMPGAIGGAATPTAMLGNVLTGGFGLAFGGAIAEVLVWDYKLSPAEAAQATAYVAGRYSSIGLGSVNLAMVNDAVRAAQFGRSFREARQ